MKIAFVGKFNKLHDEEYIVRSFKMIGHEVIRINQSQDEQSIRIVLFQERPDVLIFTKWNYGTIIKETLRRLPEMKTVCWLFDLYIGYEREYRIANSPYFKAKYVITTDGGHDWSKWGINHQCVRQGIYKDECVLIPYDNPEKIVFIGSDNPFYQGRTEIMERLSNDYRQFKWLGRYNTDSIRGMDLNELYASTKIVVGDSFPSPRYWSNRVVETLGRGGFLIHREVEGLKEEYPYLVTYDGTYKNLKEKIDYYLEHEDERREIVEKNYKWVKDNFTMDKKCEELLQCIKQ